MTEFAKHEHIENQKQRSDYRDSDLNKKKHNIWNWIRVVNYGSIDDMKNKFMD